MTSVISVIVPVYKAEKRLHECIESILSQTFQDFELILIDDGSPDRCPDICDEYARMDNRVRVIHKENGGVSKARNTGLDHSRGEFVVFVDSDDTVESNFLQECYERIQTEQAEMCICGILIETWEDKKILDTSCAGGKNKVYSVKEFLEVRDIDYPTICISGPWCKLFKASIIKDARLRFDETMSLGEDTCFVYSFLEYAQTIVSVETHYYHYYRGNSESLFSRYHEDLFDVCTKTIDQMLHTLISCGCSEASLKKEKCKGAALLLDSVKKEYFYYDKSSKQKRRQVMEKVANHPLIAECTAIDYAGGPGVNALIYAAIQKKLFYIAHGLLLLKRKAGKLY